MRRDYETATDFVLATLQKYPDRELQLAEIHAMCSERFSKANLHNSLARLLKQGSIVRTADENRAAWWAIA
jgi:hypothetical protein